MENMEISKELKEDIENKQNELKNAIRNHQVNFYDIIIIIILIFRYSYSIIHYVTHVLLIYFYTLFS